MKNIFYCPNHIGLTKAQTLWRELDSLEKRGHLSYIDYPSEIYRPSDISFNKILEAVVNEGHSLTLVLYDIELLKMDLSHLSKLLKKAEGRGVLLRVLNPNFTLDPSTSDCQKTLDLIGAFVSMQKPRSTYQSLPVLADGEKGGTRSSSGFGYAKISDDKINEMIAGKRRGLSLREIARLNDVSLGTVCRYTKDVRAIIEEKTTERVKRTSQSFDISKIDEIPVKPNTRMLKIVREFIRLQRTYHTKHNYYLDLLKFFQWQKIICKRDIKEPEQITFDMGIEYMAFLEERTYKKSVVRRYFMTLSNLLNYCVKRGYMDNNPLAAIKLPVIPRHRIETQNIELKDLQLILATAMAELRRKRSIDLTMISTRNFVGIYLLTTCGMRAGSLLSLRLCDIEKKDGITYLNMETKGADSHRVSVDSETALVLENYVKRYFVGKDPESFLMFKTTINFSRPMSNSALNMAIKKITKKAGIEENKNIVPHSFRTSWASNQYKNGISLKELQLRMNHKNINQTSAYIFSELSETSVDWVPKVDGLNEFVSGGF